MAKRALILSGGEFYAPRCLAGYDLIIACDKGYAYAQLLGLTPHVVVGDFDSYHGAIPPDVEVLRASPEKDDTDTMLAIKYALSHRCNEISLCCALGGRFDHAYANLQAAAYVMRQGAHAVLFGRDTEIILLHEETLTLERRAGYSLSLLSYTDECTDVSIHDAKYPLYGVTLHSAFPLGVSNEWAEDRVQISVGTGILLVVLSKLPKEEKEGKI